jgi:hypothetical protein
MYSKMEYDVNTNTHGEERAFVMTGQYEEVLPMATPSRRDQWVGGSVSGLNREQADPWASLGESLGQRIQAALACRSVRRSIHRNSIST